MPPSRFHANDTERTEGPVNAAPPHPSGPPVFGRGSRSAISARKRPSPPRPVATTQSNAGSPANGSRPPVFGKRPRSRSNDAPPPSTAATPIWEDPTRPAGSGFGPEEWAAARAGGFHVLEVLGANDRVLLRIPSGQEAEIHPFPSLFGQAFDGCMIIAPGAKPSYPDLVRKKAIVVKGKPASFGVIEPDLMPNEWCRGSAFALDRGWPLEKLAITAPGDPVSDAPRQDPSRPRL